MSAEDALIGLGHRLQREDVFFQASGYSALADILRRDLADLATSSGVEVSCNVERLDDISTLGTLPAV